MWENATKSESGFFLTERERERERERGDFNVCSSMRKKIALKVGSFVIASPSLLTRCFCFVRTTDYKANQI